MRWLSAVLLAILVATPARAAVERIDIPLGDIKLHTTVLKPDGAGPFPSVVALHACDGLTDPDGALRSAYQDWGDRLVRLGYVVVFPDSFSSRGHGPQCRVRERLVRASRARVSDANAARHWLQTQNWANADRVSLIGWSHGATTVLYTIRRRIGTKDKAPDFRSAIAFYPNCNRLGLTAWSGRVPTLVLAGRADDWNNATPCEQMAVGARGRSAQVQIVAYPGAYHFFDRPNEPVHELSGIIASGTATGHVHAGTDARAREDALRRVQDFLAR